jgi:hypothetical protein
METAMSKHTKETLDFSGSSFTGYYGTVPDGYGGFNWSDVNYMNATYWQKVETNWCDTGFQNVIHGTGEAFTWGLQVNVPATSFISSANSSESFSLTSMVAASAWETHQPFEFISFTYDGWREQKPKASDFVDLSQTAKTIDFAKMPHGTPTDFKDISVVEIISGTGAYGNTCTYGPYGYTTGNQMAFDNLKVVWNGKIPQTRQSNPAMKQLLLQLHHQSAHAASHPTSDGHDGGAAGGHAAAPVIHHPDGGGQHAQLSTHPGDGQDASLASQFALPQVTHFGT